MNALRPAAVRCCPPRPVRWRWGVVHRQPVVVSGDRDARLGCGMRAWASATASKPTRHRQRRLHHRGTHLAATRVGLAAFQLSTLRARLLSAVLSGIMTGSVILTVSLLYCNYRSIGGTVTHRLSQRPRRSCACPCPWREHLRLHLATDGGGTTRSASAPTSTGAVPSTTSAAPSSEMLDAAVWSACSKFTDTLDQLPVSTDWMTPGVAARAARASAAPGRARPRSRSRGVVAAYPAASESRNREVVVGGRDPMQGKGVPEGFWLGPAGGVGLAPSMGCPVACSNAA